MSSGRIVYQNWTVEIGYDPPSRDSLFHPCNAPRPNRKIVRAVRRALSKLTSKEREFIERYHFEGESYCRIAEAMGMRMAMIDGLHRRATIKLKKLLAAFMADEFNLKVEAGPECPICISQYRDEIDRLIASKQKEETWRPIIQKLKKEYGIVIKTPQILIGHQKYHQSNVEKEKK